MALNGSGPISLGGTTAGQSIEIENGGNGTTQISMNDAAVRSLAGVPSGTITMPTDFWGKSNTFTFSISAPTSNLNLRSAAVAAGWGGTSQVIATINSGVEISSSSTGSYALTVDGAWPGGVSLINNGIVIGKGGSGGSGAFFSTFAGGRGGQRINQPSVSFSPATGPGGPGLLVSSAVSITNNNTIAGGGGGGSGGAGGNAYNALGGVNQLFAGSGGGGGAGYGTAGVVGTGTTSFNGLSAGDGTAGGQSTGGSGGPGGTNAWARGGTASFWSGGTGGAWGSGGGASSRNTPLYPNVLQGEVTTTESPGGAGNAVVGNSNITWVATGNRYGGIV